MPLTDLLRAEIARRGPIPFRDFMARALYDPAHGYYASGRAQIGRGGDFFTNVSVGPLYGQLLAMQLQEMWERLGAPKRFTIVEQGAHRGDFASDVLSQLATRAPDLHREVLEYIIIEPSPAARAAQREKLSGHAEKVRWVESLDELPPFTGVHFSNELLDAFPIHLVKWTGAEWLERHVAVKGDAFAFADRALSSAALAARMATLPEVPPGYVTEVNLAALDWLTQLAPKLIRGCILAIDYGFSRDLYYAPHRTEGTLSAYAAQRREHDPLARPGEIDLTAHVEFTSVAECARALGLSVAGFTDQHHFMVGLSQLHFGDEPPITAAAQKELRALQMLMHPTMMGRSFHALCLTRGLEIAPPLAGFAFAQDPRKTLGLA